jgi:hypothetical protein
MRIVSFFIALMICSGNANAKSLYVYCSNGEYGVDLVLMTKNLVSSELQNVSFVNNDWSEFSPFWNVQEQEGQDGSVTYSVLNDQGQTLDVDRSILSRPLPKGVVGRVTAHKGKQTLSYECTNTHLDTTAE